METNRDLARLGYRNGSRIGVMPPADLWPTGADPDDACAAAARWSREAHGCLTLLFAAAGDRPWLREAADSVRRDSEQVREVAREVEQLRDRVAAAECLRQRRRDEVNRFRAERERARREREEVADALTRSMNRRLERLRPRRA
jgi:hypothetical protein